MNVTEITKKTSLGRFYFSNSLPRRIFLGMLDIVAISLAFCLALLMHGLKIDAGSLTGFWQVIAILLVVKLLTLSAFGIYRIGLAYLGFKDVIQIIKAVTVGSAIFSVLALALWNADVWTYGFPMLISDYLLSLIFIGGIRAARRTYLQVFKKEIVTEGHQKIRALLAGAGNAGELTLRALLHEPNSNYDTICFIDDDPSKLGMTIHGVPVLGNRHDIPRLVKDKDIQEILITMPSVKQFIFRDIIQIARKAGLQKIRVLPALYSFIDGKVSASDLRDVQVEDLLGRDPVKIDTGEIESYIMDKVVLVTGGAGSIGSELCNQIASFRPERLVVIDQEETGLFQLRRDLIQRFPMLNLHVMVADIQDKARINSIFERFKPQAVFHAAAYKHVGMMEEHPIEAVKNNVLGTAVVGEAACIYGADKFVLISTDKAVNPTCVMGATKRMAEIVIQNLNQRNACKFVAVRFGNVLGSRGSVVPIFREQIQRGGPVTITHPEMRRYFMTPSEAAILVLQAGAISNGGEVLVLDMGTPVAIVDLAREMIRLAGLEPDKDIQIVYTQPSPGEKMFEDILTAEEGTLATKHQRIYVAKTPSDSNGRQKNLWSILDQLQVLANGDDRRAIMKTLCEMVPNFTPPESTYPSDGILQQQ